MSTSCGCSCRYCCCCWWCRGSFWPSLWESHWCALVSLRSNHLLADEKMVDQEVSLCQELADGDNSTFTCIRSWPVQRTTHYRHKTTTNRITGAVLAKMMARAWITTCTWYALIVYRMWRIVYEYYESRSAVGRFGLSQLERGARSLAVQIIKSHSLAMKECETSYTTALKSRCLSAFDNCLC